MGESPPSTVCTLECTIGEAHTDFVFGLLLYHDLAVNYAEFADRVARVLASSGGIPCLYCLRQGARERGRPLEWVRNHPVWRGAAAYFPMKLVRETELDPTKQYLFGYHPHGVIANGAVIGFGTEALGFSKLFPGITVRPLTINANFYMPFYREIVIALGFCGPTKQSINNLYRKGHSCLIVVGGAEESLISAPGTASLVLKNRLGFVAMAIKNGASLVPVYGFGENECFSILIPELNSPIQRLQQLMKRVLGFTIPLYHGRSMFTYNYGFLPRRYPTTIIVGSPIHTTKEPTPSPELVAKVHQEYMEALQDLYDRNKAKYTHGDVIPDISFL
ncbi:diacylglycerol O-acyltransferase 1 [Entomophthora muscae]|uniref:Diacylglycerol O-acyltransferase 1 n=1 Tax=Entomophthora muscae TaxID=34485 RepID=A0ACC2TQN0_9FUNG|nr:diacylglycerol O-acyltransferase 1 [Entomophthora muscae]